MVQESARKVAQERAHAHLQPLVRPVSVRAPERVPHIQAGRCVSESACFLVWERAQRTHKLGTNKQSRDTHTHELMTSYCASDNFIVRRRNLSLSLLLALSRRRRRRRCVCLALERAIAQTRRAERDIKHKLTTTGIRWAPEWFALALRRASKQSGASVCVCGCL